MSTKTFTRVFLLALGVTAATAGCGSSSPPAETSESTSTTASPTGTSQPAISAPTPTPAPGETANPAGISKLSACTLMTQSDAASITGMSGVKRVPTSNRSECAYYAPPINANAAELFIEIPFGSQLSLVRTSLATQQLSANPNIVAVPGIGDAAYDYFGSSSAGLAFERTGIVVVILSNPPGSMVRSGSAQLAAIRSLATSIAAHL